MDIGTEKETIIVEPAVDPVPRRIETPEPEPVEVPTVTPTVPDLIPA